jgi:hypothetical protein
VNLVLAGALGVIFTGGLLGSSQHPAGAAVLASTPTTAPHHSSTSIRSATTLPRTTTPPTLPATTVPVRTVPVTAPPYVPPTQPRYTYPTYGYATYPTVTTIPTTTTSTTIAPINGRLPVVPSTLPLTTKSTSAHVSPVFAALSGIGFFLAICMVIVQLIRTRPRRA